MFDLSLFGVFTVWISVETFLLVFDVLLFCVWISDETFLYVFDIVSMFRHQTKHSFSCFKNYFTVFEYLMKHSVFHILLFGVWISDKTLLLGLIYNFFVFGYQMKHSYSCLIYHFSLVIPNKTPHLVFTTVQHTLICFFRLLLKSLTLKL